MKKRIACSLVMILTIIIVNGSISMWAKGSTNIIHKNDVLVGVEGEGALPNEELEAPEAGWSRYDDTNSKIYYVGNYKQLYYDEYYNSTLSLLWGKGSKVKFTIEGSQFRIIVGTVTEEDSVVANEFEKFRAKLYVDGEYVTTKSHTSSKLNYPVGNRIEFDYEFDEDGIHEVLLDLTASKDEVHIDAIDVVGKLITNSTVVDENNNEMVPLHKYYRKSDNTYYYSTEFNQEMNNNYIYDSIATYVYSDEVDGTDAIYEYLRKEDNRYFYTNDYDILKDGNSKYSLEGVAFYMKKGMLEYLRGNILDSSAGSDDSNKPSNPNPPVNENPYPGQFIQVGSKGPNVVKVQKRLNELGFNVGIADGDFGNGTKTAVINFQKSRGLEADGIIGKETWDALFDPNSPVNPNPPVTEDPYPGQFIQVGSKGPNVVKVQKRLNELGFNVGIADGDFGNGTKTAVINFQRSRGLEADGVIGKDTWNALFNTKPPIVSVPYPGYYIKVGSKGPNVVLVQQRLNALGFNVGIADGDFGNGTKTAVMNFQKSRGLEADGVIGQSTWDALFK